MLILLLLFLLFVFLLFFVVVVFVFELPTCVSDVRINVLPSIYNPKLQIHTHPPHIHTQDGIAITDAERALLDYGIGDVTKPETLPGAIKGAAAVVFASSASRKGGNAEAVDYRGVENMARFVCVCVCVYVYLVCGAVMVEIR